MFDVSQLFKDTRDYFRRKRRSFYNAAVYSENKSSVNSHASGRTRRSALSACRHGYLHVPYYDRYRYDGVLKKSSMPPGAYESYLKDLYIKSNSELLYSMLPDWLKDTLGSSRSESMFVLSRIIDFLLLYWDNPSLKFAERAGNGEFDSISEECWREICEAVRENETLWDHSEKARFIDLMRRCEY